MYAKSASEYINAYRSQYTSYISEQAAPPLNQPKQKEATGLLLLMCPKFIPSPAILALVLQFAQVKQPRICSHPDLGNRRYLDVHTKEAAELVASKINEKTSIVCLHTSEVCPSPGCGVGSRLQSTVYQHLQYLMKRGATSSHGNANANTMNVGPTVATRPPVMGGNIRSPVATTVSSYGHPAMQGSTPNTSYPSSGGATRQIAYPQLQPMMASSHAAYYAAQPVPSAVNSYAPLMQPSSNALTPSAISRPSSSTGTSNYSNSDSKQIPLFQPAAKKEVTIRCPPWKAANVTDTNVSTNRTTSTSSINASVNTSKNEAIANGCNDQSKAEFKFNLNAPEFQKFQFNLDAPEFSVGPSGGSPRNSDQKNEDRTNHADSTSSSVSQRMEVNGSKEAKPEAPTSSIRSSSVSSSTNTAPVDFAVFNSLSIKEASTSPDDASLSQPTESKAPVVENKTKDASTEVDRNNTRDAATSFDIPSLPSADDSHSSSSKLNNSNISDNFEVRDKDVKHMLKDMMTVFMNLREADVDGLLLKQHVSVEAMAHISALARSLYGHDAGKKVVWL
ncbi:hypothetical protein SeLEV6574_g01363 [Synchytrium endobioticum]|nr:hypothetical protein SeLEV6574_g01363 [Synchytrium endobioticum]